MARPGARNNPKIKRLVHLLGQPFPHVLGYLQCMWEVGYECGNDKLGDATDVELAAEYPGEPGAFFKAVLDCRLIDDRDGVFHIHDLFDHCPEYVKRRHLREQARKNKDLHQNMSVNGGQTLISDGHCPPTPFREDGNGATPTPTPNPTPKEEPAAQVSGETLYASSPVLLTFPAKGGRKTWDLTEERVQKYREAFPGVDVMAECRKALIWAQDNPGKCKTASPAGWPRCLLGWLDKAQNKSASGNGANGQHANHGNGHPQSQKPKNMRYCE